MANDIMQGCWQFLIFACGSGEFSQQLAGTLWGQEGAGAALIFPATGNNAIAKPTPRT